MDLDGESELGTSATFSSTTGYAVLHLSIRINADQDCGELRDSVLILSPTALNLDLISDTTTRQIDSVIFSLNNESGETVIYSWTSNGTPPFSSMEPDPDVPQQRLLPTLTAALGDCVTTDSVTLTIVPPITLILLPNQVISDDVTSVTVTAEAIGVSPDPHCLVTRRF
ncbi:MAG: hypothetical protein R2795_25745 [Saprospiraceae bacterium]